MRWRRRGLAAARGLALALLPPAAAAAVLPAAALLPPEFAGALRAPALGVAAALSFVALLVAVLPAWRRTASDPRVARALDDAVPQLDHSLLPAVDLARALDRGELDDGAASLARRHLADAADRAPAVVAAEVLPWSSLGREVWLGPGALVAVALLVAMAPGPWQRGWAALNPAVADEAAVDSEPAVEATLSLRNVRLVLTPPAYSKRPALTLEGTSGDFQAMAGTTVALSADGPSGTSSLARWQGAEAATPGSATSGRIELTFEVPLESPGYRVSVERSLGRRALVSRLFTVERIPDHAPELEVLGPRKREQVTPDGVLNLQVRASDDYGLSRLELVIERRGRPVARRSLADVVGSSRHEGAVAWTPRQDLGDEGGELELVVEAWDNDAVSGPKRTRSKPVEVYVPTPRDLHRKVGVMKRELLDRAVDLLGDLLVDTDALPRQGRTGVLEQHDKQHGKVRRVLELGAEIGAAMAADAYELQGTFEGIGTLLANLGQTWQPVVDAVDQDVRPQRYERLAPAVLRRVADAREGATTEVEKIVLDLAEFAAQHQRESVLDEALDLEPKLSDLADLLRQAQDGKPVAEQIAQKLKQLQKELMELAMAMAQQSPELSDGFANQVPPELSPERAESLEQMLAEGRFEEAQAMIQQMLQSAQAMREELREQQQQSAGNQQADQLAAQLQQAIDEVSQLEEQQQALLDETEQLHERLGAEEPAPEQLDELVQRMEQAQQLIEESRPQDVDGLARYVGRIADQRAQETLDALRRGQLDEAAALAEATAEQARDLGAELAQSGDPRARQGQRQTEQAARAAEGVASELESMVEQAAQARQQAASEGQPLGSRQRSIEQGVAQMQGQQPGGSAFRELAGQNSLESARQLMQKSEGRLGQGRTGQSVAAQEDALRQLQAYRQSLEQSQRSLQQRGQRMQPGAGSSGMAQAGGGQGQPNPFDDARDWGYFGNPGGEVEMSDPDDFVSPEAFRRLVQEGAQQEAPERYEPFNRSYYEELVR